MTQRHDMKIVQTFWTKPYKKKGEMSRNDRRLGGFFTKQAFFNCWALSVLQAKKFFNEVVFYGDDLSIRWFKEQLKLPYDKVYSFPEDLAKYDSDLWAIPKLCAYRNQDSSFLHIDGDFIFLDQIQNINLSKYSLVSEFLDRSDYGYPEKYYYTLWLMKQTGFYIPSSIEKTLEKHGEYRSSNAGIIGGRDAAFFKRYFDAALEFVERNISKLDTKGFDKSFFNCVFEQFLFYALAEGERKQVFYLYENSAKYVEKNISLFSNLEELYQSKLPSIHLLSLEKMSPVTNNVITSWLKKEYPEYHERIFKLLKAKEL